MRPATWPCPTIITCPSLHLKRRALQALLPKEAGGRAGNLGDVPFDGLRADTLRAYAAVACALPPGLHQGRQLGVPGPRELLRSFVSLIRRVPILAQDKVLRPKHLYWPPAGRARPQRAAALLCVPRQVSANLACTAGLQGVPQEASQGECTAAACRCTRAVSQRSGSEPAALACSQISWPSRKQSSTWTVPAGTLHAQMQELGKHSRLRYAEGRCKLRVQVGP